MIIVRTIRVIEILALKLTRDKGNELKIMIADCVKQFVNLYLLFELKAKPGFSLPAILRSGLLECPDRI
jgi:hypothetical protein